MTAVRRTGAFIGVALSALLFVGCLALLGGAWVGRAAVLRGARHASAELGELTDAVDAAVGRLDAPFADARERIASVRERAAALAASDRSDADVAALVKSVRDPIRDALSPAIERVAEAAERIRDRMDALRRTVRLVNEWTGALLPTTPPDEIAVVTEAMTTARTQIAALNERLASGGAERRQEIADDVTRFATALDASVASAEQRVAATRSRVTKARDRIDSFPDRLDSRWLLPIAIVATLVFGWLGLGQLALLRIGWRLLADRPGREA